MGSTGSKSKSSNTIDEAKLSTPILVDNLPKLMTADMIRLEFPRCAKIIFPPTTQVPGKAYVYFWTNKEAIQAYHQSSLAKADLFRLSWICPTKISKHSSEITTSLCSKVPVCKTNSSVPVKLMPAHENDCNFEQPPQQQPPTPNPEEIVQTVQSNSNGNNIAAEKSVEDVKRCKSEPIAFIKKAEAMPSLLFKPNEIMISNLPENTAATLVTQLKRVVILYTREVELSPDATFITIRFKREEDTKDMVTDFKSANFLEVHHHQFSWNESDEAVIYNLDPFQRFGDFGCGMGQNDGHCQISFQLEICYLPATTTKTTLLEDFPSAYQVKINKSAIGQIGILRFGPVGITEWNYNRAKKIFKGHRAQIRLMKIQKYPAPIDVVNIPEYFTQDLLKQELPTATKVEVRMINKVGRRARIYFKTDRDAQLAFETLKKIRFFQANPKFQYNKDKKIVFRNIQASYHSK